jgi:type IV secretory pathway VirB10-like protein
VTRRALATISLAMLAGASLLAGRATDKAIYTCGTVPGAVKRAEGRMNTLSLSALSFTPDSRSTKPLLIRYKSITRLEYGRTAPHPIETSETPPIALPCTSRRQEPYLIIFYEAIPPDEDETSGTWQSKEQRDKEEEKRREKERPDLKERRERAERRDRTDPAKQDDQRNSKEEELKKKERMKEKEYYAVFELGDKLLRPTLRVLENRSGKRVKYQDAEARKAAR